MDELTQASHKMAEKMYQASGGQPGAGAPGEPGAAGPGADAPPADESGGNGDGKVVDAEFEETN